MLSDSHGWTMLKPQGSSASTAYCYVHPGETETSEGDSNFHRTRIKLSNGLIPSLIEVNLKPKQNFAPSRKWSVILVAFSVLMCYSLLAFVFLELRSTKNELRALEKTVKALASNNDENLKRQLSSKLAAENVEPSALNAIPDSFSFTTPPVPSSTEREKRETISANPGFPLLAHYRGGLPEYVIEEGGDFDRGVGCPGLISPWSKDKTASGEFALKNTTFKEAKGSVVVPESGLYFIYSQVFYLTRNECNSYSITLLNESGHETVLATCSAPPNYQGESSCYTATARALKKNERLQLKQRERDRHILLRQGQTFLGLVLLSPSYH